MEPGPVSLRSDDQRRDGALDLVHRGASHKERPIERRSVNASRQTLANPEVLRSESGRVRSVLGNGDGRDDVTRSWPCLVTFPVAEWCRVVVRKCKAQGEGSTKRRGTAVFYSRRAESGRRKSGGRPERSALNPEGRRFPRTGRRQTNTGSQSGAKPFRHQTEPSTPRRRLCLRPDRLVPTH